MMELYGFKESSISWMKSYLSSRSQCVYIDGELSDTLQVDVGVPQGSVLGGLLYVLLVGDLKQFMTMKLKMTMKISALST